MCGIVGFLDKRPKPKQPVGQTLLAMLQALSCRGPDSAGVAIYGPKQPYWIVQVKLPETGSLEQSAAKVLHALQGDAEVLCHHQTGSYLRLEVERNIEPAALEEMILKRIPGTEVVSLGHQLEIVKQVGSPRQLEESYGISKKIGRHGIGHTRLSTESKVDLSHSQPFWAHGVADLATVHNGHITNYHKLRRQYEQRGRRFFTDNDSEVIGVYLQDRLSQGMTLLDAICSSIEDFDGSFSYLVAGGDGMAYVRDRYGLKPLVIAETNDFVAIATEEIALRQALGTDFEAKEPPPGSLSIWSIPSEKAVPVG